MIDYLEQESGQADALEEQRRRLAAALIFCFWCSFFVLRWLSCLFFPL